MIRRHFHRFLFIFLFGGFELSVHLRAQDSIPFMQASMGASIVVDGIGSVDVSVGQVFFMNEKSGEFSLNQGIQQPFVNESVSTVRELSCNNLLLDNKEVYKDEAYTGVIIMPYIGGNGVNYLGLNTNSSSVLGLTLKLEPGKLANGNGSIELMIKGTPKDTGIAVFTIDFGRKMCTISLPVKMLQPKLASLYCSNIIINPKDIGLNLDYTGTVGITYQGGNEKKSYPISVASSGVKGLTLKADSTLLKAGGGTFILNLSGKATEIGTAVFPVNIGDKTCNVLVSVIDSDIKISNLFTPNGDGKNDLWSIPALAFYPKSKVFIFDRFGRLLIEYAGSSPGWNGLINNYQATAGDYWYVIQVTKDSILKGNFTLLR